jgi:hypothetical protein
VNYFPFQASIGYHDKEGRHASHVTSSADYTIRFPLKIQVHHRLSFECLLKKIIFSLCFILPHSNHSIVVYVQCCFFFHAGHSPIMCKFYMKERFLVDLIYINCLNSMENFYFFFTNGIAGWLEFVWLYLANWILRIFSRRRLFEIKIYFTEEKKYIVLVCRGAFPVLYLWSNPWGLEIFSSGETNVPFFHPVTNHLSSVCFFSFFSVTFEVVFIGINLSVKT